MILDHPQIQAGEAKQVHGRALMVGQYSAVAVRASGSMTFYSHRTASDEVKVGEHRASYLKNMVVVRTAMLHAGFRGIGLSQVVEQFLFAYW
jgi:hypothetical protein